MDNTGLGVFFGSLPTMRQNGGMIRALGERWWDCTKTFQLPAFEVTMTPMDFHMITGLSFEGEDLRWLSEVSEERVLDLLGPRMAYAGPTALTVGGIFKAWTEYNFDVQSRRDMVRLARSFLLYGLCNTIFANSSSCAPLGLLGSLEDLGHVRAYAWGRAGFAASYMHMDIYSRCGTPTCGGYLPAWTVSV